MTRPYSRSEALETALLYELQLSWSQLNAQLFRHALQPPTIEISDVGSTLARWNRTTRTLQFARKFVFGEPWTVVIEVMKHEIAHQYVSEVLQIHDEPAHGPAFRKICAEKGIDAAAAGLPVPGPRDEARDRVVRRIQKLLALGESPNANEAEAAMRAATRLMLEHNLAPEPEGKTYGARQLGEPSLRIPAHERVLAGILAESFFVRAVWVPVWIALRGRRGKVLEISGTPANLETADYVHTYVLRTADRLWRADPAARNERARFLLGVMLGFRDKLAAQRRQDREEGLVWVGDAGLDEFFDRRYPRLRQARPVEYHATPAWHRGILAGRGIELHSGVTERPENRRRLIGRSD